jgi:hypothetical protein
MPYDLPVPVTGSFPVDSIDNDLGPYLFLQAHQRRADRHLVCRDLGRAVTRDVLPARHRVLRDIDTDRSYDVLVEVDDVLLLLRSWRASADVWLTTSDAAAAESLVAEIRARMPQPASAGRVEVAFTDAVASTRHVCVDVREWGQVRAHYPAAVRSAVDTLATHRPQQTQARRLLLWHGRPGTGKTTAIRALLDAWRDWADGVVVTDPDALMTDGRYLRRVLLDSDDERWKVLVLEDAESLLHKGSGAGMARLLNLADGLLGQGLRCLFLITTNEPLGAVHPALVRPGRCLATVEFGLLSASEAAAALGRPVDRPMSLAEVMVARPVSVQEEEVAVGQYL